MKRLEIFIVLAAVLFVLAYAAYSSPISKSINLIDLGAVPVNENTPPCIQLYYYIDKYAEEYNIPKAYAYGVAHVETGYRGPFHWSYNPAQTSSVGAVGPMQIMPTTAKMMWPKWEIDKEELRTNIEFNAKTSMKLLRYLYDRYGDWKTVFGCYNTGRPCVNEYAERVHSYQLKP
jgi:soluble lytic murein transglycosylase-like protein